MYAAMRGYCRVFKDLRNKPTGPAPGAVAAASYRLLSK